ncbi:molybdopterin-containing oxidoreductase family protein [Eggerthella sinensis]|uniref:Molybdopterin oxidoreductase n=1 Tax=Eggerthella sinensis TaxID=242230 RepID=A0A3N0IYR9_9ACTN|nr:molybdopterin-dependent oxidoreductase [Eggerthella sinensis]RDB70722.1 molybdopterin oxidoreductase [Eggerthella sinensis]RNM41482.1 molybdopterin oxidoreductase [Eggerthella sinensis]
MDNARITRRSFVSATAIAGLVAATGGTGLVSFTSKPQEALAAEESETRIVKTCCAGCVGRCGVLAHVKNGRVVKLEGDPDHVYSKGAICAKGLSFIQALYNPNRIKYPLKRVGERGSNQWERISWEQALDEIADQLLEIEEKYGAEAIQVGYGGGGSTYYDGYASRWCHVMGCHKFEPGGLQCLQPRQTMSQLMWGKNNNDFVSYEGLNAEFIQGDQTKCMVLWGSNPASSCVASGGRPAAQIRAMGAKTVVVDPRMTADASKADVWLPVRPGSDVALLMCWINYIMDNELYNRDSVMKWTNMPYLVNLETGFTLKPEEVGMEAEDLAYLVWDTKTDSAQSMSYPYDDALEPALEGGPYTVNGIRCTPAFQLIHERCSEWTLEKTAEICWLEADMIEEAIRLYAENTPGFMSMGMTGDHAVNSPQVGICQFILEAMMGNYSKPGTMMQMFSSDGPYWPEPGTLEHFMTEEQYKKRFGCIEYKASCRREWTHNSLMLDAINSGEPYRVRAIIERSLNKMMNMPNAAKWGEAFESMDLNVHHIMYPTSFSMYCDYLLPTTEWLENHWGFGAENRFYVRQPTTHLWESVEDPMFFSMLAKKMADKGHQRFIDSFDPEKCKPTPENLPEGFAVELWEGTEIPWEPTMEDMLTANFKSQDPDAMSWEELCDYVQEHGYYETCSDEEYQQFYVYERIDEETGKPQGFNTPSKKLECYGEQIITLGRTGAPWSLYELEPASFEYDPLPYYREPNESPLDDELAAQYPLVITGGHVSMYTHGTLRNVPWIRERFPVPEVWINPVDAEKYGIEHKGWVWLESPRGKTQARANVTKRIAPGVTWMERFWFPETVETSTKGFTEMNINMLTNDQGPFADFIGSVTYRGFQVRVTPAESAPEGIWTEPEQFEAWLPDFNKVEVTDDKDQFKGVY